MKLLSKSKFIIKYQSKIKDVIKIININGKGLVFLVDDNLVLKGSISDGDIRRGFLKGIDINDNSIKIANKSPYYLTDIKKINISSLSKKNISLVPIVDKNLRVISISEIIEKIPISKPYISHLEIRNISKCLQDGFISSQGKFVKEFEKKFSKIIYGKNDYALSCSSGTSALNLALQSLDFIENKDEIIVPDVTFGATINSIINSRLKPVIVPVKKSDNLINLKDIDSYISNNTKGIILVNLYGQKYISSEIINIKKKYKLKVIEDCAESLGTKFSNRMVSGVSDAYCYSFFANKIITTGEGGMVIFKSKNTLKKAKIIRDHGMDLNKKYWHISIGNNFRLTNIQAAIGLGQLKSLNRFLKKRHNIFEIYKNNLGNIKKLNFMEFKNYRELSIWTIIIFPKTQDLFSKIIKILDKNLIEHRPTFYQLSEMSIFKKYKKKTYPKIDRGIQLPISNSITKVEILKICSEIKKVIDLK